MSTFSDKAKAIIAAVAPILGGALGGPLGAVAGTVISKALGGDGGDQRAAETALLSGNPDALVKLKQAEMDFKAKMAELGIEHDRIMFDDTANARAREAAVKDNTPKVLAYTVVLLALGAFGVLLFGAKSTGLDPLVEGQVLGALEGALMLVLGYYFGSSAGSRVKDDAMTAAIKAA